MKADRGERVLRLGEREHPFGVRQVHSQRPLRKDGFTRDQGLRYEFKVTWNLDRHHNEIDIRIVHQFIRCSEAVIRAELQGGRAGCLRLVVAHSRDAKLGGRSESRDVGGCGPPFSGWTPMMPTLIGLEFMPRSSSA